MENVWGNVIFMNNLRTAISKYKNKVLLEINIIFKLATIFKSNARIKSICHSLYFLFSFSFTLCRRTFSFFLGEVAQFYFVLFFCFLKEAFKSKSYIFLSFFLSFLPFIYFGGVIIVASPFF